VRVVFRLRTGIIRMRFARAGGNRIVGLSCFGLIVGAAVSIRRGSECLILRTAWIVGLGCCDRGE